MKYLKEFTMILLISFLGEALKFFLPFPVPTSIYGLVLMLALLCSGIVKPESVEGAGDFLVEIMPVLFIPAAVGLLDSWAELKKIWIPVTVITLVTTVFVMVAAGRVTQYVIRKRRKENDGTI